MTVSASGSVSANVAWNPRLAHLRGVAALLVLVFHVFHVFHGQWKPFPWAHGFGWVVEGHTGVSLFFVLSGFLFMTIAQRSGGEIRYGEFMRNRLLRIFPLFLVVYFVAISVARDAFRPADLLYLLVSNLGDAPTSKQFITGAAWTISVEFTFYLIFPFLARFALEQGPGYLLRWVLLLFLFKAGAYLVSERPTHMLYSTLLGRLDQFLIGMLAAQLAAARWAAPVLRGWWVAGAGALLFVLLELQARRASYFLPQPRQLFWLFWPTVEAAAWAAVVATYAYWRGSLQRTVAAVLERAGEISFSLYLWHGLIIYLVQKTAPAWLQTGNPKLDTLVAGVLVLGLSWWVSTISYRTIEAPFLGLRRRYVAADLSTNLEKP
jgi:peptidoglycan/LPS O-acetylase OafA/YrhL